MKVLLLGPERSALCSALLTVGDVWTRIEDKIDASDPRLDGVDFLVSYGYRHILVPAVLDRFPGKAVNLHVSLLPWNRGADPNLWSFLEDTPKGVTIHRIDKGVDTGYIVAQRAVGGFDADETLASSYRRLSIAMESLFAETWPQLRTGSFSATPQPPGGTYHRSADKAKFGHLLTAGWDTPVSALIGKAKSDGRTF